MNEEDVSKTLQLLQQNKELLNKIHAALPDSKYYKDSADLTAALNTYLKNLPEKEKAETEQIIRMEELLKSIDEKTVVNESQLLSAEMYAETSDQMIETMTQLNEQMSVTTAHLQNIENIQIPMLCGVGMIFGVICTVILSRFMHH